MLKSSIRARGQQTPIEVVRIDDGAKRYGLISGFRRYMAISALRDETGAPAFATIKALVKPIETVSDRYVAMVEENEIRLNLSFYERAKLAAEAARMGVYPDPETAVRTLFAAATPAKRSKILSFVRLHDALGDVLRYPSAIPEKLGLKLVAAISEDPRRLRRLKETLRKNIPDSPDKERAALDRALAKSAGPDVPKSDVIAGVRLDAGKGRVVLSGKGVTPTLIEDLEAWLKARGADDACLSHAKIRSL
ncbi:MAG: ParB N-terminal domain-containing protein [Pseudomonadota bacterium]